MSTPPPIPLKVWTLMAEVGPRWAQGHSQHIQQVMDAFVPVLEQAPKEGITVRRDRAYGADPRQVLDVYLPPEDQIGRPALIFVHGGAFTEGNRDRNSEIYANVPYYFANHGIVGINGEYRLAPQARYPEGSRDAGAMVAWVRANAEGLGVDPERIFLMGHSAGGAHVASYAYERRLHPAQGPGIAGVIIVSGRVRADNLPENPNARRVEEYYGSDPSRYDGLSAISQVDKDSLPTLIAFAEYENPLLDVYSLELAHRLALLKRRAPRVVYLAGHNHASIVAHFNTAEERLGQAILEFIERPH
jgi:acetyl esterase